MYRQMSVRWIGIFLCLWLVACGRAGTSTDTFGDPGNSLASQVPVTSTATYTAAPPTSTSPATSTPTQRPTSTPQPSASGMSLNVLEDGSTQFTDEVAQVRMTFPAGWLVMRMGESEYFSAAEKQQSQQLLIYNALISMQNLDPAIFRLNALDVDPKHILHGNVSRIGVIFGKGDKSLLKDLRASQINSAPPLKNYKLISADELKTEQGIDAVSVVIQWDFVNQAGQDVPSYRKRVLFKTPTGSMALELVISTDKKEFTLPLFDQVINSINFLP